MLALSPRHPGPRGQSSASKHQVKHQVCSHHVSCEYPEEIPLVLSSPLVPVVRWECLSAVNWRVILSIVMSIIVPGGVCWDH